MKNLLIGLAVGILIGIGIGYLIWGKNEQNLIQNLIQDLRQDALSEDEKRELFNYLLENYANKIEFDSIGARGSNQTDFIDRTDARNFVNLFETRFASPAPMVWEKKQTSWRVDGSKLRALLNQTVKGDTTKIIESVLFEMGINPKNPNDVKNQVTLIITGLEREPNGDRYRVMGKTDLLRWGTGVGKRQHSDPTRDYILEFVDPCIPPPCPKNTL